MPNQSKQKRKPAAAKKPASNPIWGGHFAKGPAEAFAAINPSITVDARLWAQDIAGSLAHAHMLAKVGVLNAKELAAITRGLRQIEGEISRGELPFSEALEDIHMNIESRLKTLIGEPANKLHTARSRNDQVATDFRLFARDAAEQLGSTVQELQRALHALAAQHIHTILPGMTHLQPAQPIVLAHHLLAYIEMFARDRSRLRDAITRLNECPLGAAALAGTTYPIDRMMTAKTLGFARPMRNSLDAVSDRDYALELLSAMSVVMMHLSRLAEELIFWSNPLVGFVTLDESFTSGSSIMPQKRNADAAELVRGKAAGVAASFQTLWGTMKALPLAYNKDMQEDKRPFFFALDETLLSLKAMTGMIATLRVNETAMKHAAALGYLNATDLADHLVQAHNISFREAHHLTGKLVRLAEERGIALDDVPLKDMQKIVPSLDARVFKAIALETCIARRTSLGGTAPAQVKRALQAAAKEIR